MTKLIRIHPKCLVISHAYDLSIMIVAQMCLVHVIFHSVENIFNFCMFAVFVSHLLLLLAIQFVVLLCGEYFSNGLQPMYIGAI